jgi:hypothetical protein
MLSNIYFTFTTSYAAQLVGYAAGLVVAGAMLAL